jgi:hypothetical protein
MSLCGAEIRDIKPDFRIISDRNESLSKKIPEKTLKTPKKTLDGRKEL